MMMIRRVIIGLLLFSTITLNAQENDFGIWSEIEVEHDIFKKTTLAFSGNVRTFENSSKVDQAFLEGGIQYSFFKYLSVSGSYRLISKLEDNSFYYTRHKLFVDIGSGFSVSKISFSGRLRFQRTTKTYQENQEDLLSSSYARFRLKATWKPSGSAFRPYIAMEPFMPLGAGTVAEINKYRFSAGSEVKITPKTTLDIGYLFEKDYQPRIKNLHVIQIGYSIRI